MRNAIDAPEKAAAPRRRHDDDRRRRVIPLFSPERRTGFDRRRSYPVTGTLRDRPHTLVVLLLAVNALSLLDFVLTYVELSTGVASEGNPVMAALFEAGPMQAWLFKTIVIALVSVAIWRGRQTRAILGVAVTAFAVFSVVVGYHLVALGSFAEAM